MVRWQVLPETQKYQYEKKHITKDSPQVLFGIIPQGVPADKIYYFVVEVWQVVY